MSSGRDGGLSVAVTGPTGDIGRALLRALDTTPGVGRVVGMARRPFDPADMGLKKVEYRQGDILDRASLEALIDGADVVVHLAFLIFGAARQTTKINIEGSQNVFRAALGAPVKRLIYTSSVAAYGFHKDNPDVLTEDVAPRGTDAHYYSAQKAQLEDLLSRMASGSSTDVYVFRPCTVVGPTALSPVERLLKVAPRLPGPVTQAARAVGLARVIPDPGIPFQLVHEDDVARAIEAAVLGEGEPGVYNLAADGAITVSDVAEALGWRTVRVPRQALDVAGVVVPRLPLLPPEAKWVNAVRVPMLMDCTKARDQLGWRPKYDCAQTLEVTIAAARERGLI